LIRRLRDDAGYSLVEVMASIVIMTLAILPMMAMFDTGLHSATTSSNYDRARMLANLKLEQAKSLPFDTTRDTFPEAPGTTTTYDASGYYQSAWKTESGAASADFTNFEYRIEKQYMAQPPTDSDVDPADPSEDFSTSTTATNLIRVTVTVRWGTNNTYTTFGLVTR
jgi:Tfp pilus assembly protein PilV